MRLLSSGSLRKKNQYTTAPLIVVQLHACDVNTASESPN